MGVGAAGLLRLLAGRCAGRRWLAVAARDCDRIGSRRSISQLASQRFSEAQLRSVLDELYPSGTDDTASDRTRRSREQTKQRITDLLAHGDTQGNAPGSKWAAINAIIEHSDWIRPVNSGSQRFARAIDDAARKTRALELVAAA